MSTSSDNKVRAGTKDLTQATNLSRKKRKTAQLLEASDEDAPTAMPPPAAPTGAADSSGPVKKKLGKNDFCNYIYAGSLAIYAAYRPLSRLATSNQAVMEVVTSCMDQAAKSDGCVPLETPIPNQKAICMTHGTLQLVGAVLYV